MNKIISFAFAFILSSASLAESINLSEPVNFAKLSVGFKVQVPEGLGFNIGAEAPVMEYLALGGEFSYTGDLEQAGRFRSNHVIRIDMVAKPRYALSDRFEIYAKTLLGPAFQLGGDRVNFGIDFAVLPGFQFSMGPNVGVFSELGFGLTSYPRTAETDCAGIFRTGLFFAF